MAVTIVSSTHDHRATCRHRLSSRRRARLVLRDSIDIPLGTRDRDAGDRSRERTLVLTGERDGDTRCYPGGKQQEHQPAASANRTHRRRPGSRELEARRYPADRSRRLSLSVGDCPVARGILHFPTRWRALQSAIHGR